MRCAASWVTLTDRVCEGEAPRMEKEKTGDLLMRLLAAPGKAQQDADLSRIGRIPGEEIPEVLGKELPEDFGELLASFSQAFSLFRDLAACGSISGKKAVAMGGLQAGRRSFLGMLAGRDIAPWPADAPCGVPFALSQGKENSASTVNMFGAGLVLSPDEARQLAGGFGEECALMPDRLVRLISVTTPALPFEHLSFLDIPDLPKTEGSALQRSSEMAAARARPECCSLIVWFVTADPGMVPADELSFLRGLDRDVPKIFVISGGDTDAGGKDLSAAKERLSSELSGKGIACAGIFAPSGAKDADPDSAAIEECLRKLDDQGGEQDGFARSLSQVFASCVRSCDDGLRREKAALERIRNELPQGGMPEPGFITELAEKSRRRIGRLACARESLRQIHRKFFTELQSAAGRYGVRISEPSVSAALPVESKAAGAAVRALLRKQGFPDGSPLLDSVMSFMDEMPDVRRGSPDGGQRKMLCDLMTGQLAASEIRDPLESLHRKFEAAYGQGTAAGRHELPDAALSGCSGDSAAAAVRSMAQKQDQAACSAMVEKLSGALGKIEPEGQEFAGDREHRRVLCELLRKGM